MPLVGNELKITKHAKFSRGGDGYSCSWVSSWCGGHFVAFSSCSGDMFVLTERLSLCGTPVLFLSYVPLSRRDTRLEHARLE
jgi:hypothetical protein